jgi:putative aldouronate transport system permease protein
MKQARGESVFNAANAAFFTIIALLMIFPFWHVLMTSFVTAGEYFRRSLIFWPQEPTLKNYRDVMETGLGHAFLVSVGVTAIGSLYSLAVTLSFAYALSKPSLPGRRLFMTYVFVSMFFSGGLIPYYILIRDLGLIDNPLVLVLPFAVNAFWLLMVKAFFEQYPVELEESARLDGANDLRIFARIVLPT